MRLLSVKFLTELCTFANVCLLAAAVWFTDHLEQRGSACRGKHSTVPTVQVCEQGPYGRTSLTQSDRWLLVESDLSLAKGKSVSRCFAMIVHKFSLMKSRSSSSSCRRRMTCDIVFEHFPTYVDG